MGLGLSGVVPTLHFVISEGLIKATTMGQMGWLLLMATLYITGACLYAARIPERFFPGKCDIWVGATLKWTLLSCICCLLLNLKPSLTDFTSLFSL